MTDSNPLISLEQARHLVELLEQGAVSEANQAVEEAMDGRDQMIYQQVGQLTRQLHDSVEQFKSDLSEAISDLI